MPTNPTMMPEMMKKIPGTSERIPSVDLGTSTLSDGFSGL